MLSSKKGLAWGLMGTGNIAHAFARGLAHSRTGQLAAVASRQQPSADAFAKEFGSITAHGSYEKLLADSSVQAVYISTPHPHHAEWCIKAARAGKHILCEKPLTLNHAEAMVVAQEAQENGVFLMEAFMYRCHPQTAQLVKLIREGAIGQVQFIKATFGFKAGPDPKHRLFSNELGGGGILDVGCYAVSIARLVAGAAQGLPFVNPTRLTGFAELYPETGTDLYAAATAQFPGGIIAELATAVAVNLDNELQVFGTKGSIRVPTPYLFSREGGESRILLKRDGAEQAEEILIKTDEYLYGLEADAVGNALAQGWLESPCVPVADSLGNMAALDAWRQSANVAYEVEKPDSFPTVSREPLRKRADATMTYGSIAGVKLPVSRLVMGVDNQLNITSTAAMLDSFFERGGNTFDTAYVYGAGLMEKLMGQWLKRRAIRSEMVLIAKGAHTPFCTPAYLHSQFQESLDRLQTDYADIYFMHRDNPDVPVGEFVDVLNEHYRAGRIRAFGGSNWTLERLQEADAYASKKGLQRMNCLSNNFSLARMVTPMWDGCVSAKDAAFSRWLKETGTSLLAWSSQAHGYFAPDAYFNNRAAYVKRAWDSDDNLQRRERAFELARRKGVEPINIALAYVLHQAFPTFALIGPRQISETVSTMRGLTVALTPEELRWLNLESDES